MTNQDMMSRAMTLMDMTEADMARAAIIEMV